MQELDISLKSRWRSVSAGCVQRRPFASIFAISPLLCKDSMPIIRVQLVTLPPSVINETTN